MGDENASDSSPTQAPGVDVHDNGVNEPAARNGKRRKTRSRSRRSSASSKLRSRSRSRRRSRKHKKRRSPSRSRSHSSSRSRSRTPKRRRSRRSRSRSASRSRTRSRSRSRGYKRRHRSPSRSRSPGRYPRSRYLGPRDCPAPSRCLGVFGMNINTTESTLAHYFQPFGKVEKIQIVYDAKAKDQAAGLEIDGYRLRTDFSLTQRPHTPTPGIYMGKPIERSYGGGRYGRSPSPYRRRSRSRSYS